MLNRIRNLLTGSDAESSSPAPAHPEQDLAAAALLIEAAKLDNHYSEPEQAAIRRIVQERFGLNDEETESLMAFAEGAQNDSNELYRFTSTLKNALSEEERIQIIELLWEVVYADGTLHDYEANLLRRVGGLLHVPDRDRGNARRRVLARLKNRG